MNTHTPRKFLPALFLAPAIALSLSAQEAAPAPGEPASAQAVGADQPIVLERFTVDVTRDQGYVAVDSLAGGRTNTPIRLTPAAMSSVTRAFIDDLGIRDVREALRWAPNVLPEDPLAGRGFGGQAFQPWAFNFRGVGAGQQGGAGPTRNYFTFFENADAYNIERVEFTRGPNGILFGLGTVGGTLSTYTKVPRLDKTFISPAVIADDNGGLRFELDYNLAANDQLAIRLNALHDDGRGWRNGDDSQKRAIDLAFLYKLSDRTTLRLEIEGFRSTQTLISSTIGDKASGWDGQTASETWGALPIGSARTVKISAAGGWGDWLNAFPVYTPGLGKGLMLWAPWTNDPDPANPAQTVRTYHGGYASTSSLLDPGQALIWAPYKGWYPDQIKLPWETAYSSTAAIPLRPSREWTYGHGRGTNDYENLTAFIDHSFNESLDLQIGFFTYDTSTVAKDYEGTGGASVDINRQLPDGTSNPNFGKPFADFFLSKQTQDRSVDEIRAQLNYNYRGELFGAGFNQLLAVSASERRTKISARQYLGQIANSTWVDNPRDWVHNMIFGRIYLDRPNDFQDVPDVINGYSVAYLPKADGYWFDFDDKFDLTSYALFSNSRFFDEKLSVVLGVRYDSYDEDLRELRRGPDLSDRLVSESDSGTTYTAGAIYYFGWLGVFANYSENILPPSAGSQPYLSGSRPGPEQNQGYDYGLRISTKDGKYYANISRYDSQSQNRNVENPVDIRGVWQAYNIARGANRDDGFGAVAYSDTTAMDASGYEFEVTANPLSNLRLQASYSLPDTEIVDFYPMTRAHVQENLPTWQQQLDATTDPLHASDLRNAISRTQDKLAQSVAGAPQQRSVDYTASFFANYTFTNDMLDGFSFGAGASYTGKPYAATYAGEKYYGSSVHSVDAVLAYETTIGRAKARFAINVQNVFDYDEPLVLDYHNDYTDMSGRHIRNGYFYQTPRTFRFTARFTF
ncbi:TonB-dependent siderophore receptor [Opitutus terrae]|uniref:TonB-dependent receptor plug n=1 Tax=Opitutus terrae (strain DSM 11246 / JCM 15787 / PB90-1) TaxID=452637 RepID=B1ZNH9_OPITP|nr:TonB-dependent receptor plug domain-containing protein [Opitutus terrae]ACB74413.1 TonB-dependent receptor plug [Opitutus terrae PB90-1]